MSNFIPDSLRRLELGADADQRAVKRAYARELKRIDQFAEPERFEQLRQDYENALAYVQNPPTYYVHETQMPFQTEGAPDNGEEPLASQATFSGEKTPTPPESLQKLTSAEVVGREMPPFMMAIFGLNASDQRAQKECLQDYLWRDALAPLDVRDEFERELIKVLANREFGQHSGPLLFVVADVFGWHRGDSKRPEDCGPAGVFLSNLLDEFQHWRASQHEDQWIQLAGDPPVQFAADVEFASDLLYQSEGFKQRSPLLFNFFLLQII